MAGPTQIGDIEIRDVTAFVGSSLEPARVDIAISGGRISRVVSTQDATSPVESESRTVLDGRGLIAIPGFVDCHDHLRDLTPGIPTTAGRPLSELLPLLWRMQEHAGPEEYRLGALLATVQRQRAGVTTIVDHCYPFHVDDLDRATISSLNQSRVKWFYARGIMTRPHPTLSEPWPVAEARVRTMVSDGLVPATRLLLSPVSIRQASLDDLRSVQTLASELGCIVHMHVAENESEDELWQAECGDRPIPALKNLGLLNERMHLVHCIHINDADIQTIAARGSHVIDCPGGHLESGGKGFTRSSALLGAGVNVALGLDKQTDPFFEVRLEAGLGGLGGLPIPWRDALSMATAGGARALGIADDTGTLKVGAAADIVLLDATRLESRPSVSADHIVSRANAQSVRHVLIDGEFVVRDHRSVVVDEESLTREVEDIARHYLSRAAPDVDALVLV